jgi:uncharacterized protein (TIGR03905 family)
MEKEMKELVYKTRGTCSREIYVAYENDEICEVRFFSGCSGNTAGISSLVRGMKISDAIERLEGIKCGMKSTSCPDQLAQALKQCIDNN